MRKINFKKDVLPHLVAITIFLALTLLFFKPAFFDGQSLYQGDIEQWKASATEILDHREATGEEGLWTNSIFGGMPAYMISVKWGNQLIKFAHAVYTLGLPHPARILFATMLSFYIMLLCFKVRPYLAIIGAIAFGCSSYHLIGFTAGHNARISAVSFMPLVIGAMHLCFTKYKWLGGSLTALALAMQLRVNHIQMTYYLVFVIVIYGIIQLIYHFREGELKHFLQRAALLVVAAILAIGTYFGEFYATYEYGKYSNRGKSELTQQVDQEKNEDGLSKSYAFLYSNGIWDPITLFIPNALGGSVSLDSDSNIADGLRAAGANETQIRQQLASVNGTLYWGKESPTTYYAGAVMVFLFVIGILFVERKYVIWLVAVAVLGIILSYGRNMESLNFFFFDYLPGYNKFRSVTFTMVLPIFAISLLGMLGLEKLLETKLDRAIKKKFLIALGSTAGLALLLTVFAGIFSFRGVNDNPQWPEWLKSGIIPDRKSAFRADTFRTFIFIALFAGAYYLYAIEKLSKSIAFSLFILIAGLDVVLLGNRFIDSNRFQNTSAQSEQPLPGDQYITQNKSLGDRVIDLGPGIFYDARASRFNHSINGYHGARIRRFQELLDADLQNERLQMRQDYQSGNLNFSNYETVNMLNGRFVMANPSSPQGISINTEANGAAWFVKNIDLVNSPDDELSQTQQIDTKNTAVIDQSKFSGLDANYSQNGIIDLVEYHPGYWKYESNNSGKGLAIFSEIHYPVGFEVTIDGEPVEMLRANYILRALEIPAGQHTVEFNFAPKIYKTGTVVMQIFSILVLLLFFASVYTTLNNLYSLK
ncbi:YfhO family protein [Roseivirga sp.]|uniref:YfhO family protein n=1 Tax=Roseivirga sp. TaxID=1964215 RepID=UPI003B8C6ABC